MNKRDAESEGDALLADLARFRPEDLTMNGWAVAAGVSRAVWGDIRRHGNPSRRTLERLLTAAGSSLAEFEALSVGSPRPDRETLPRVMADPHGLWRPAAPAIQPIFQTVGHGEIHVGETTVPSFGLANGRECGPLTEGRNPRFAIQVCVSNMEPRFRSGRAIVVDRRADCRAGDDVLIGLRQDATGDWERDDGVGAPRRPN